MRARRLKRGGTHDCGRLEGFQSWSISSSDILNGGILIEKIQKQGSSRRRIDKLTDKKKRRFRRGISKCGSAPTS